MIKLVKVITRKNLAAFTIIIILFLLVACVDPPYESLQAIEEAAQTICTEEITVDEDDTVWLEDNIEEELHIDSLLKTFFANEIEEHRFAVAGLSATVFTRDSLILEFQHGYENMELENEIDYNTVFEWGSITKLLVYISAMQLYEQGALDLHADIFDYISQDDFSNIIYSTTMYHLINHTAGFDDLIAVESMRLLMRPYDEEIPEFEEVLKDISGMEFTAQNRPPGEQVKYSNYGVALAAHVIEQISGIPFYEYVHDNIFNPLAMTQTSLLPDSRDNYWVRSQRENINSYEGHLGWIQQRHYVTLYPAGAAVGTISDLVKFGRALFPNDNEDSLLFENPETMEHFYPSFDSFQYLQHCVLSNLTFVYGFIVDSFNGDNPTRILGHSGGTRGFYTHFILNIDKGIGIIISSNSPPVYSLQARPGFLVELIEITFGSLSSQANHN